MTDQPEPDDLTPEDPIPDEPNDQQPEATPVLPGVGSGGQVTTFTYDAGGLPLSRIPDWTYRNPPETAADPTPAGADGPASVVTRTYDAYGMLTGSASQLPFGHVTTYTYDAYGDPLGPPAPPAPQP